MKKLLVLLALCMVLAVMFVACNNEPEPPVEETTAGSTEAPTTEGTTEAPTTETQDSTTEETTEAPTTETQAPTTETTTEEETTTEAPDPAEPTWFMDAAGLAEKAATGNMLTAELNADEGYVRLTATGGDPYFQFLNAAGVQPQYMAIVYRTNTTKQGQIFIGSGAGPNAQGDNPTFSWNGNEQWNILVLDLANMEGLTAITDGNVNYARLDFFTDQGNEGDYLDLKYVGFYNTAKYATDAFFANIATIVPAVDMADSLPGNSCIADVTTAANGSYISVTTNGSDPWYTLPMINGKAISAKYVAIKYRTTATNAAKAEIFVGSGAGPNGQGDNIQFELVCDGNWQLAVIDLSKATAVVDGVVNYLRWDAFAGVSGDAPIDLAYIGLFASEADALAYDATVAGIYRNVPYHVDENVVLGVRDGGTPFTSASDKKFGQRFNIGENFLKKVTINDLATYSDGNANTWSFKVWAWNTDYATTVAGTPLFEVLGENHPDNQTFVMDIPVKLLISGDIYYELEYLSGSGGFTGWVAKDLYEGIESYVAGNLKDGSYAAYITVGVEAEMNENGDTTKHFASDVNANEVGTALGDTDLKNFFITELPLPGSGIEAFGDGKIYHMTSINDMFADMNGYFYITATDVVANAGGCNFLFIRGYSAVNSDEISAIADPTQNLYKINNYYETDTAGGQSGLCGGAGIYAYIAEGKLYIIVKYYDAEAITRVGNYILQVAVEGDDLTIADNGELVSFIVDGKTYATIALEGAIDYADIKEVKPAGQFVEKATVKLIDGTEIVIENTLVAATVNSQVGVASRGGSIKFTSLTIGGYSEIEVPELVVEAPANQTATVVIADYADANAWENSTLYSEIQVNADVTVSVVSTVSTGYAPNSGKYYTSGEGWRTYQTEAPAITVTAAEGKTIVSVKITYESNKTGVLLNGEAQIETDAVIEVNANSITLGVGNTDASVTNGQVRITAIEVVYN